MNLSFDSAVFTLLRQQCRPICVAMAVATQAQTDPELKQGILDGKRLIVPIYYQPHTWYFAEEEIAA